MMKKILPFVIAIFIFGSCTKTMDNITPIVAVSKKKIIDSLIDKITSKTYYGKHDMFDIHTVNKQSGNTFDTISISKIDTISFSKYYFDSITYLTHSWYNLQLLDSSIEKNRLFFSFRDNVNFLNHIDVDNPDYKDKYPYDGINDGPNCTLIYYTKQDSLVYYEAPTIYPTAYTDSTLIDYYYSVYYMK